MNDDYLAGKQFVTEHVSLPTVLLLKSYQQWGILSRTFMLQEHATMLADAQAGSGKYATYPDEARRSVIASVYVELFERLCLLIEDFLSLCHAAWGELTEFPIRLISQPNPKNILREFTSDKWAILFRWCPVEQLNLSLEDQLVLSRVRAGNVQVLDKFLHVLTGFVDLYWVGWTKRKHGNTWIQTMIEVLIEGEPTLVIPVIFNTKNPTVTRTIIINNTIYTKWQSLSNELVLLSKDVVDAALALVDRAGMPLILSKTYYTVSRADWECIETIIRDQDSETIQRELNLNLETHLPQDVLEKHLAFYSQFDLGAFQT
jgi:hypothetical protein